MRIADIIIGTRHRKDMGDIAALAKSIDDVGLLHPVVVRPDGVLIAGERRIRAAQMLGWTDIPATVIDLDAVMRGEIAENVQRKDFAPSEAVAIWQAMESHAGERSDLGANCTEVQRRDQAAAATGVSARTLSSAKAVVDAAEREPERFGDLAEQMDRTGNVSRAYQEVRQQMRRDEVAARSLPVGVYRVLYADPPWQYANSGLGGSAEQHYATMSTAGLCALDMETRADTDAVLFLWATNAMLPDALSVMGAWGFAYKTNFCWIKDRATYGKLGFYNYGRHELLLVGTKGSMLPAVTPLPESVLEAKKGEHSRKPEEVYALIEAMYPNGPYLELFARRTRAGWSSWGNEVAE